MKINKIFWSVAVFSLLVFLPEKSFAVCQNNFSASFQYQGQDSQFDGDFSDKSKEVPTGNYFRTSLELKAIGADLKEKGENINIVLVMDRSGSMARDKIESAKNTLNSIVETFINQGNSENKIALVTYNQNVTLDGALSSQYSSFTSLINAMVASGRTNIGDALSTANSHLLSNGEDGKRWFIVLASDGLHNTGTNPLYVIPRVDPRTTVYTVGIGSDADTYLLEKIARESGTKEGKYYYSEAENLENIFKEIMKEVVSPFQADIESLEIDLENISNGKFTLANASPVYASFDNQAVTWADLGVMKNKDKKTFYLTEKNENAFGQDIAVNKNYITINYIEENQQCSEIVPIEIVKINNIAQCTGIMPPDPNSVICSGDDSNLLKNWESKLVSGCTSAEKCEYICDPPYIFDSGICRLPACSGTIPSNAVACNNNLPLIDGTPWKLVENCSTTSCTYQCDESQGYQYWKGQCVIPVNGHCGSVNVFICSNIPSGLCASGTSTSPAYNSQTEKWEWQCKGQYGGSDSGICQADDYCKGGYYEVNP